MSANVFAPLHICKTMSANAVAPLHICKALSANAVAPLHMCKAMSANAVALVLDQFLTHGSIPADYTIMPNTGRQGCQAEDRKLL